MSEIYAVRHKRRLWPYVAAGLALLAAGGLAVGYALGSPATSGRPTAAATSHAASPAAQVSPLATLDEHATCVLLVPALQDVSAMVLGLSKHPDGSTLDHPKLLKLIGDLSTIKSVAPFSMRTDIATQLNVMKQIENMYFGTSTQTTLRLSGIFADSGVRLGETCLPYAD